MSRFKNLFGKNPERQSSEAERAQKASSKGRQSEAALSGSVASALDEIEAEDFSLDSDRIEDQLIQFEPFMAAEPRHEAPVEPQIGIGSGNDIEAVKRAVDKIEGESKSLHAHLSRLEKDLEKLISAHESLSSKFTTSLDAKREPIREAPPALQVGKLFPRKSPKKEERVFEDFDDVLPPFRPLAWEDTVEFVPAVYESPKTDFPVFNPKGLAQTAVLEEFKPGVPGTAPSPSALGEGIPILTRINRDYLTLTLVMRWIEFLFERITRDKISLALDYYVEIGWISEDVKHEIMSIARGEMQDVTKYMAHEEAATAEEALGEEAAPPAVAPAMYKKIEDWRLAADDHLKSLLFICNIAGIKVDKDKLNSMELMIQRFKESLENFHGV
jgi:flagellar protein FlaD